MLFQPITGVDQMTNRPLLIQITNKKNGQDIILIKSTTQENVEKGDLSIQVSFRPWTFKNSFSAIIWPKQVQNWYEELV